MGAQISFDMISAVGMTIDLSELRRIGSSVFFLLSRNHYLLHCSLRVFFCLNLSGKSIVGALDKHIVYIISKTYLNR